MAPEDIKTEDEIQRWLIQDRMWKLLRIEKEDYNLAIAKHRLEEDEHVLRRTEEVENRISEELRACLIEPLFQNPQEDNFSEHLDSQFLNGTDEEVDGNSS